MAGKLFNVKLLLLLRLLLLLLLLLFRFIFKLEQPIDGGSCGRRDDITADNVDAIILFQLSLTRLRGGPIGGICCVARARNASAIRCG